MMWIELGLLVFLLAGGLLVGRAMGGRRRDEEAERRKAEADELIRLVANLKDEVERQRVRIEVLERLATDDEQRVAREIDKLRRNGDGTSPQA